VTKHITTFAVVVALCGAMAARAQEKQDKPAAPTAPAKPLIVTPLKVQIILARYQGEKKTSSLPFTISVNANDRSRTSLRMGASVPIVSTTFAPAAKAGEPAAAPLSSYSYKDLGTSIDCMATTLDDGRFRLDLVIDDSSLYSDDANASILSAKTVAGAPAFRSFKSTNTLVMKDGQSTQFTTATDKISGEVVKIDVTLTVVK